MMQWGEPENLKWLWLAAGMVLILIFFERVKRRRLQQFGDEGLVQKLASTLHVGKRRGKEASVILAVVLLLFALAIPQRPGKSVLVEKRGLDIVLAVDVSSSMLAEDIRPNRLDKAKLELQDLVDKAKGDRIGVVAFAGEAYVQVPLTLDRSAVKLFIRSLSPNLIPLPGTAIGKAIQVASQIYVDEESEHKVLVLLTDGEDHESDPIKAAMFAKERGVRIYAIGIGTPQGEMIPLRDQTGRVQFKKDLYGNFVVSKLDEKTLQEVTRITDGVYYRSRKGNLEVDELYQSMRGLGVKETGSAWVVEFDPLYRYFLIPAFLLLIFELVMSERRRHFNLLILLMMLPLAMGFSRDAVKKNSEATTLYEKGNFSDAERLYMEASKLEPDSQKLIYNLGNAQHMLGNFKGSNSNFKKVIGKSEGGFKANAYYNLGNTLFRQKETEKAIDQYKDALRLQSDDEDAKYNLELLLKSQEQQQDQQQSESKSQKQDSPQDQKNEESSSEDQDSPEPQNQDSKGQDKEGQDQDQGKEPKGGQGGEKEKEGSSSGGSQEESEGEDEKEGQGRDQEGEDEEGEGQNQEGESEQDVSSPEAGGESNEGEGPEEQSSATESGSEKSQESPERGRFDRILDALADDEQGTLSGKNTGPQRRRIIRDKDW